MNSMTGMGRVRGRMGNHFLTIEVKSINHKFCEVHSRLPTRYQQFEIPIVQLIKKTLARGKIDISFFDERAESDVVVNRKALKNYFKFLTQVKRELKMTEPVHLTHLLNGASFWMARETELEKKWPDIKNLVEKALAKLLVMRGREGQNLQKQISQRLKNLRNLFDAVAKKKSEVVSLAKQKLEKRIEILVSGVTVDPLRLATEVAFLADRSDVSEELERLTSHFSQMEKLLAVKEPAGRPLDFLIQEINREWNTIASKSQDAPIAWWVVQAKSELEKIREQVQNIE